jgi:hypothetical protein
MLILNDSRSPASPSSRGENVPSVITPIFSKGIVVDDYTYQMHETERGTHILVFKNGEFERRIIVPVSEYKDGYADVLDGQFCELYSGPHKYVLEFLERNADLKSPKMIAVGKDKQILSVSEYKSLYRS